MEVAGIANRAAAEMPLIYRYTGIAHPPSGSIEIMFIKGLSIQASSEPILSILERSAWGGIRGHVLK